MTADLSSDQVTARGTHGYLRCDPNGLPVEAREAMRRHIVNADDRIGI
jgi:hypothetical protein